MFVFSFKASTLKYIGVMSLCAVAIVLTVFLVPTESFSDNGVIEVSAEHKVGDFKGIKTNEDRLALLESYGWEVESEPVAEMSVTLPEEFDSIYSDYNKLQKKEGLDLKKYLGKKVKMYIYRVTNGEGKAYATLLVYKDRVIGGDISSAEAGGYMYSFSGK